MKRIRAAIVLLGLVALNAVSVQALQALQARGPGGDGNQIFVANHSVTPVRIYVEDASGARHELGRVERGHTSRFDASDDIVTRGDYRVVVRPCEYTQFSRDPVGIKTKALGAAGDQTVILWLERDLSRSKVEVRPS